MENAIPLWQGSSRHDNSPTYLGSYDLNGLALQLLSSRQDTKSAYFMPVSFFGGVARRTAEAVEFVHALVVDIDGGYPLDDCLSYLRASKVPCIVITTHSHQLAKGDQAPCDRYRVIVLLSQPVPGGVWKELYARLAAAVTGTLAFDRATSDPNRLWFFPPLNTELFLLNEDCQSLDPFALLASHAEPAHESEYTVIKEHLKLVVSETPWATFDRSCSIDELVMILMEHGFHSPRESRHKGNRSVQLTRPGKNARDGISVAVNSGNGAFVAVFSTSIPEFADGLKGYSAFEVVKRLKFGGDRLAAAKWAREWCASRSRDEECSN